MQLEKMFTLGDMAEVRDAVWTYQIGQDGGENNCCQGYSLVIAYWASEDLNSPSDRSDRSSRISLIS